MTWRFADGLCSVSKIRTCFFICCLICHLICLQNLFAHPDRLVPSTLLQLKYDCAYTVARGSTDMDTYVGQIHCAAPYCCINATLLHGCTLCFYVFAFFCMHACMCVCVCVCVCVFVCVQNCVEIGGNLILYFLQNLPYLQ